MNQRRRRSARHPGRAAPAGASQAVAAPSATEPAAEVDVTPMTAEPSRSGAPTLPPRVLRILRGYSLPTVAGLLALVLGGWAMYQEAAPNLRDGTSAISRVAAIAEDGAPVGLTLRSQHTVLLDCEQTLRSGQSLEMRYLSEAVRERLPRICATIAQGILARTPADSFAWLVLALAEAQQGHGDEFNEAFARAHDTGRREGWLASMRVTAAQRHADLLSPAAVLLHEQDLQLVAGSAFAPELARTYLAQPAFRAEMNRLLESMPPADQRNFLFAVQQALSGSGR